MTEQNYTIRGVPQMDLYAAFKCEGDRAASEQMTGVASRQHAMATHIRNASAAMQNLCPEGYRVECSIVFEFVPNVNAVAREI